MVDIIVIIALIVLAIVLHEVAHGWVAFKCGDPTAKNAGRLTLNPLKHVDPFGSIILPGILILIRSLGYPIIPIGWAKPVPVNFMRLNNPKRDMIWVGMAGPIINMIIATLFVAVIKLDIGNARVHEFLILGIFLNVLLAMFNMIPIPPLDGSRLVMGLLPNRLAIKYSRLERYGILIVFALLPLGLFHKVVIPAVIFVIGLYGIEVQ